MYVCRLGSLWLIGIVKLFFHFNRLEKYVGDKTVVSRVGRIVKGGRVERYVGIGTDDVAKKGER
jgi:hypothetical protein